MSVEEAHEITDFWMPHFHCVLGDTVVITLHLIGDLGTALAYFLIPATMIWTGWSYRLKNRELRGVLNHGAAFIVNCGLTHVLAAWNWFHTHYVLSGAVAFLCALVSLSFVWRAWRYLKAHPLKLDIEP